MQVLFMIKKGEKEKEAEYQGCHFSFFQRESKKISKLKI